MNCGSPFHNRSADDTTPKLPTADDITPELLAADDITPELLAADDITPELLAADDITPELLVVDDITPERLRLDDITPKLLAADDTTPKLLAAVATIIGIPPSHEEVPTQVALHNPELLPADDTTPELLPADDTTPELLPADDTTPELLPAVDTTPELLSVVDITLDDEKVPIESSTASSPRHLARHVALDNKAKPAMLLDDSTKEIMKSILQSPTDWFDNLTIDHVQSMLKKQFPHIAGLHSVLSIDELQQPPVSDQPFVQILYTVCHWIVVSNVFSPNDDTVYVYDSGNGSLTEVSKAILEAQVASFSRTTNTKIIWRRVQQQRGDNDCGAFAVANATALCAGTDPWTLLLDQDQMRPHILKCVTDGIMRPFPMHSEQDISVLIFLCVYYMYCLCCNILESY